jgi:hypothetical protein
VHDCARTQGAGTVGSPPRHTHHTKSPTPLSSRWVMM